METLGAYLVLVFFAAQFVAFFNWTNLGLIFAVNGAGVLSQAVGLGIVPLMIAFIVLSAVDQPVHGLARRPSGHHGAGVRADVHAAGLLARADAGRLPHRRLA